MRAVVQRVLSAEVVIENRAKTTIGKGYLVLLGVDAEDAEEDAAWLAKKIASLRIFGDDEGMMNLNLNAVNGQVLVVSQFTLHAKTKKGTRPSFIRAAAPDLAIPLYERFIDFMHDEVKGSVKSGEFGADMRVSLINDGPVTIIIDTKNKE